MLVLTIAAALLSHGMLLLFWGCRHDGQSAMCCPCVGCGLFVLVPTTLVRLVRIVEPGPARTVALLLGLSVFLHFTAQIASMLREDRKRRTKR